MTTAFWIDDNGTEHQIDSSRPSAPGWSVVHFVDGDMGLVQNDHVLVHGRRNAPGAAATASGSEETNPYQEEGSDMKSTATPSSYLVMLVAAGLTQIVAHASTFKDAIALITADASRRFGWGSIEYSVTTGDYVRMTTTVGLEVEYRILPHDRPVPEDEPSVDTDDLFPPDEPEIRQGYGADGDDDEVEVLHAATIGEHLAVSMERYRDTTAVTFTSTTVDFPELPVEQIPALIDALTEMHRTWLHAGGAA